MDTRAYLDRVLPRTGHYAMLVIASGGRKQTFFSDIESLEAALRRFSDYVQAGNNANVYVAVNSFRDPKLGRKQENVAACRAFYVDIDCGSGKPYPTQVEGAKALAVFLKATGLPTPVIISSGRGIHAYWVLDHDISPSQWKPIADTIKLAAVNHKFEIDMAVPGDSARVLRATGTYNTKGNDLLEVKLLRDAPNVTLEDMQAALAVHRAAAIAGISAAQPLAPRSSAGSGLSPLAASLVTENIYPPANGEVVATKCQQMNWIVAHQEEVSEPIWYAMLGVAAHCEDAETLAVEWSNKHPGFDHTRTVNKLHQWQAKTTGPTLCTKFEELRPGGCKGCPLLGKIKSPCALGLQYAEIPQQPEEVVVHPNYNLMPPKPFKRTEQGVVMTVDGTDVKISPYDIFPLSYGRDESLDYEVVRYMWRRPHEGWQELSMRQAYLTDFSKREFATVIGDKGIVLVNGSKQTETFQYMLRAYMDELRNQRGMTNHYNTMGWKDDHTKFLIGSRLYRLNDVGDCEVEDVTAAKAVRRSLEFSYKITGSLDKWVSLTEVLARGNLFAHQFALLVSLSAPFYEFCGLKGMTLSLYGATGTGKTLAQYFQQSVWGDPMQLHYTAQFTQNALFSKMATYNNLPFTIDEATTIPAQEVGEIIYWVSQGRDKARLDKTAAEREPRTWGLPLTVSTNRSFSSALGTAGMDTEAQLARMLEITMPETKLFSQSSDLGRKMYDVLASNFGHAGDLMTKELVTITSSNIRQLIESASNTFRKRYGVKFAGQERYWEQALVLADIAGDIATRLGLLKYDYKASIQWVLDQLVVNREHVSAMRMSCFDVISEYLSDSVGSVITVMHTDGQSPIMDHQLPPRGELRARYDVYRQTPQSKFTHGTLTIERKTFKGWLYKRGGDYRTFMMELNAEKADVTPKSGKFVLGKDTPFKLGQSYVLSVDLSHAEMQNTLNNADVLAQELAQAPGKL